ncbi:MAG: hypothetical protein AUH78_05630 [Gemmatimonadetes bacterium 13_1_40CM_4_69_8]|nr:MAG: hypothetical protein AUH78_05630 [Gemmatimonadetes bacterium 13_1_40CM_4_69_8]
MNARRGGARPPLLVLLLGAAFLLLVAALLIGSFTRPEFPPYRLSVPLPTRVGDSLVGPATYTLDASATDRWRTFAFARNAVVEPPGAWDIAFRRFHLIAADGAGILDLGPVPFDSVRELPPPAAGYRGNTVAGEDTTNPGVGKWYQYSMLSHLLTSKHHVYGVRTADGHYAKLELLAYYCADAGTACITFRYAYQGGGDRSRRVAR